MDIKIDKCPHCGGDLIYDFRDYGLEEEYIVEWYICKDCGKKYSLSGNEF